MDGDEKIRKEGKGIAELRDEQAETKNSQHSSKNTIVEATAVRFYEQKKRFAQKQQ